MPALLKSFLTSVIDAIWPPTCIVCGGDERLEEGEVCAWCLGKLLPANVLPTPKPLHRLDVAFAYETTLRQIMHRFKFEQTPKLARPLAERMAKRLDDMSFRVGTAILVPVPDHATRRRERGYNPASEIARYLAKRWDRPLREDILRRVHYGPHQSILSDIERRRMHLNTFTANKPLPGEETTPILLVDDVVHTGTTVKRAASALKKAGWQRIDAVSLSG